MKSVIFQKPGGPEVMELLDLPKPSPGPEEILIRTSFMAVSKPDVLIRQGVYKWSPPLPASPGNELVGTIEKVGKAVTSLHPDQKVLLSARELPRRGGCYTEYISVPFDTVHLLPDAINLEKAAVIPTYNVAYAMLYSLGLLDTTQTIFVTGAAGSISSALTDLAKTKRIRVIGTVSTKKKAEYAKSIGVDDIIYYKEESVLEKVMSITGGRGVDIVFDHVIGEMFIDCLGMLADFGTVVAYNQFSPLPTYNVFEEMRSLSLRSPSVRIFNIHTYDRDLLALRSITKNLIDMLVTNSINPKIGAILPISEAAKAHILLEKGHVLGKILLKI